MKLLTEQEKSTIVGGSWGKCTTNNTAAALAGGLGGGAAGSAIPGIGTSIGFLGGGSAAAVANNNKDPECK